MASPLRSMLVPVYLPSAALAFAEGALVPVLPVHAAAVAPSLAWVGLVLAAQSLGMLLTDLPAGALLRRLGGRRAMGLGVGLSAASTLGLAFADAVAPLVALRLVSGVGAALFGVSRHAFLADATRGGGRGRAVAAFGGVTRIGGFVGPAAGGALGAWLGLDAAFALAGLVAASALPWLLAVREPPLPASVRSARAAPGRGGGRLAPVRELWGLLEGRRRAVALAAGGQVLAQGIRAGRRILVPLWGASALGLEVDAIGTVVALAAALDASLFAVAGRVMDRWGRKWAIVPCFAVQALGMALLPLSAGLVPFALAALLMGLGNGLGAGTMMTLGADLAPEGALGGFLGAWRLVGDGGGAGVPLLVGAVAQALALPVAALAVAGLGFLAAAVFAFGVPETRPPSATPGAPAGPS